jgi:hypothetical protein
MWTSQGRLVASPDRKEFVFWRLEPFGGRFNTHWEIRDWLTLAEGSEGILDLQFSRTPDGEILGSSSAGGTVRWWRAQ